MDELNADGSVISLLPGETVDNIFDHLYNDIPTLSASSLVCRAWVPSCRYHLFHTVECNSSPDSRRRISHLHDWLLASPNIHPYIQTLNIVGSNGYHNVYVEDVEQVLQCLPFLQNLALRGITICSHDTSTDVSYVSSLGGDARRLRCLVISNCATVHDVVRQPLCRVLGLFTEVDRLAILGSVIGWDPDDAALSRISSPLLELAHRFRVCRELRLRSITAPGEFELMRFLIDHSVRGDPDLGWPLRELWFKPATLQLKDDRVAEAALIHHSRKTLRSIFLDLGRAARNDRQRGNLNQANGSAEYCSALCLGECTRMESLHLQFSPPGSRKPLPRFALEFYISCLAINAEVVKYAPSSVKTITLAFPRQTSEGGKCGDLHPWDSPECSGGWNTMDAALTQLPKLT
ncbi:hypothetical protein V8D89_012154, partial [Ganoderma adspersum]